ncbi:TackOD1 domain-containing metal-binding protein [Facilibium subflavum]|uniref:TackOD1 domain-containing metal-binding protein n=1 Tax=Facilibium subflavum TaxID=2219058 RepID=UPI000E64F4B8|nr:hypothetical protein [Facilibium subflavum]
MTDHYHIAVIQNDDYLELEKGSNHSVSYFTSESLQDLNLHDIDIMILTLDAQQQVVQQLQCVRSSEDKDIFLMPVFTAQDKFEYLYDGIYDNIDTLLKFCRTINEKKAQITNIQASWQARCFAYFYTRAAYKNMDVSKDWHNAYLYYYPVIELFNQDNSNISLWLDEIRHNKIIQRDKHIAAFFCCNQCYAAHLEFSEHCPKCKSFHIETVEFIHCFHCGNTDLEKKFMLNNQLRCPQCHSKLKQFGIEYDRPLESYLCQECQHKFSETEAVAACMLCGHKHQTHELAKQSIYNYKLTETGKRYIQYDTDYSLQVFDEINYLKPEFFYAFIEWSAKMYHRNKDYQFSLIMIKAPKALHRRQQSF